MALSLKDAFEEGEAFAKPENTRESNVEGPSKRHARERGWWVRKFKAPGKDSEPDDIFMKYGYAFFVEFKAPGKDATDKQKEAHEEIRTKAGANVYVCDDKTEFKMILAREEVRAQQYALARQSI